VEIGRQNRPALYDLGQDRPPPLVPRVATLGGQVVLSADLAREAPRRLGDRLGLTAVQAAAGV
jgi:N-methylhydantoinase A/oxoprolinase/acetone carboxylase beta subunit